MLAVEDVVFLAADLLGVRECINRVMTGGADQSDQAICEALVRAYNMMENEIATEYAPIVYEETISCVHGKYEYESLHRDPAYIIAVYDNLGAEVEIKLYPTYFELRNGNYNVRYATFPTTKGIGDDSELPSAVSERVAAYGVAAEYCVQNGLYTEHAVWDKKYKTALTATLKTRGSKVMKGRSWS